MNRTTKLRIRRGLKRKKRKFEAFGVQAEENIDLHFFKRLNSFLYVRRFVFAWLVLVGLLIAGVIAQNQKLYSFYQEPAPAPGGTFVEGALGAFTNANPIYATKSVDKTVSRLVFSSLMQHDRNNELVGDVAESIKTNDQADNYTVKLRDDVYWHDGKKLTSKDVAFTFNTIQNPDTNSPLLPIWQKIKITTPDELTVVFELPHSLASFPESLTTGIAPEHLLSDIPAARLRSVAFNTAKPIGSGPFKWDALEVQGKTPETRTEQIGLVKNQGYYRGAPYLDRFTVKAFRDKDRLLDSLAKNELTAVVGLNEVPTDIPQDIYDEQYNIPMMAEVATFFKNSNQLLGDKNIRQALVQATNRDQIRQELGYPTVVANSILLKKHTGYNPDITQLKFDVVEANKLLDKAGWSKKNADGIRTQDGQELSFNLFTKDNPEYARVASLLQRQWKAVGVKLNLNIQGEEDLQSTIAFHNYDILLFGIALGNDPDVYGYWHSTQASPNSSSGLNFSEYKSDTVDQALEGGRSRVDPVVRAIKYEPMLKSFRDDAPATALYQPRLLYLSTRKIYNFEPSTVSDPADRFTDVETWAIRETRTDIIK